MQRVFSAVLLAIALGSSSRARAGEPVPGPAPPPAEVPAPPAEPPDTLDIEVLTFGPGDHPFFRFGHDALLVRDTATHQERVYNFGTFLFDSPRLIGSFMKGRLTYWLSVSSLDTVIASYKRENRTISTQRLALDPGTKRELAKQLEWNARPENRAYRYDYFLDNCSTRVRDAVDRATHGALHRASQGPGRLTLRDQALRLTADVPWLYLALDLVLAGSTDKPIDRWAEMYIPEELARGLETVSLTDGATAPKPLIASSSLLATASRPPPRQDPPARFVSLLLVGLAIGLVFVALGWATPHRPAVRAVFGVTVALWSLVVGFIGCFLVYTWGFTDHVVAHRNENIFLCAPWGIVLAGFGFGVAFGSRRAALTALRLSVAALLFALLGWGLKASPAFHQHNAELIALLLPPWFGMSVGLLHARHGS
jgi:hypothetical protein